MPKITYNKQIEPENKAEIEHYLTPLLWLVPNWVLSLNIKLWDSLGDGELASVSLDYAYRVLTIELSTAWLDRSDEIKQSALMHELLHGYFGLIADYAREAINNLCPVSEAEKFNRSMIKELTTRHEAATEELTFALTNKLKSER